MPERFDHVIFVSMESPATRRIPGNVEILSYLVRGHYARIACRQYGFHAVPVQLGDEIGDGPVIVRGKPELRCKTAGTAGLLARQIANIDVDTLIAPPLQRWGDIVTLGIGANDNNCLSL